MMLSEMSLSLVLEIATVGAAKPIGEAAKKPAAEEAKKRAAALGIDALTLARGYGLAQSQARR
jgi:hypothetical protein